MSRIESLTPEQVAKFPAYAEKWLKVGLSTAPCDRAKAEASIVASYRVANISGPKGILWVESPLGCVCCAVLLKNLRASVEASVEASVRDSVLDSVWASVGGGFCYGSHDASWLAFYEFFLNELDLKCCEKLAPMMHTAMHCGWWLPYENMVIASEKPSGIHLLGARIHRDGGPAVLYRDGFSVWALNGVRVSQGIAETPADRLDAKLVLSEKNAEVRREIVRKIGVHRVVTTLGGKELETWGNYSLISLDLGDGRHRPYLKMLNPSTGTWHIEGVHPDCHTIEAALNWRNGTKETPTVLA